MINVSFIAHGKILKKSYKNNKFKIPNPTWNEYILKKHREKTYSPLMRIYVNKTENSITFEIKTEYYLELLTPEAMTLLGSTKNKMR